MQFWTELDVVWTSIEILTKMIGKLRRLKEGNFSVENFLQSIDGTLSWCSIGDIPAEARFLENMWVEEEVDETLEGEEPSVDEGTPVSFHSWNDLAVHNDVGEEVSQEGVRIITFGLRGIAHGRRDTFTQSLRPRHPRRLFWNLWQDSPEQFEALEVYFVRPQPWEELQAPGAIILLVEVYHEAPSERAPILPLVWDDLAQVMIIDPHAMFVPGIATRSELLRRLPFGEMCSPIGLRPCAFFCGTRQILSEDATNQFLIGKGYLCKLKIQAENEVFVHAERWVNNFERFAMTLLKELPAGKN